MRGSLELGRVWGISIRLHGSWLVVFGLVAWSLAQGYLPAQHPGWRPVTYWAVGAATGLLFFASVLVHELGHARMALRHGLSTRSITLFVFGGVAGIRREPPSPGMELQIALAGPLTSLALAGLFGALGLLFAALPTIGVAAGWLAQMNLALAVFNTLPGFPLDGGRILRAALWWWTGRLHRATQLAAFTGQILAFGLVAVGAVAALGGNLVTGIWLAFIGWFLHGAATAASTESGLRELLRGVTVEQAMSRDCARVPPELPLERLVQDEVFGHGRRAFLVVDDGRLRGLLTLHEIKGIPRQRWRGLTVADVMRRPEQLTAVGPQEPLLSALEKLDDGSLAQLPVVSGGQLLGLLGREQVLHYLRLRAELGE